MLPLVSEENIIENISHMCTDLKWETFWGINKNYNWNQINQNTGVLLWPTESKHSVIEIEMQNKEAALLFKNLNLPMLSGNKQS